MRPDWLVVIDDCLTMRYGRCIFCTQPIIRIDLCWLRADSFAMAVPLCAPCAQADVGQSRCRALVEEHARQRARTAFQKSAGPHHV